MYRDIPDETHIKALKEAIQLDDVKAVARKYNISESTIHRDYKLYMEFLSVIGRLGPKKNTLFHRMVSRIRIFLFLLKLRVYVYFEKWKDYSGQLDEEAIEEDHSDSH